MALPEELTRLIEDGLIDDVEGRLMSGKEAAVFVVERDGMRIAAKVYKERDKRTFKATASYTEGRNQTRNSRDKRAMGKRTSYGKGLIEESWREMEYRALSDAFDGGVRVPEPIMLYESVLLMELVVDEEGSPAPRLADFELTAEVAELLHLEIFGQVRRLLSCGLIHGDLSAFNILIAPGGPTLIDMPQVVDAATNNSAQEILRRDLKNLTEHLARFEPKLMRFSDCGEPLWRHYERGTLDQAREPEEGGNRGQRHRGRPPGGREQRNRGGGGGPPGGAGAPRPVISGGGRGAGGGGGRGPGGGGRGPGGGGGRGPGGPPAGAPRGAGPGGGGPGGGGGGGPGGGGGGRRRRGGRRPSGK